MSAPTAAGTEAIIEFRGAGYRLPSGQVLLTTLSLTVWRGETLVLLGRSGAGKTTALKLINRLLEPSDGEVRIEGRATLDWDPIALRRHIGYVIQETGLFPHYTVEQNISLVPRLEDWPAERIRARSQELLALVGLDPGQFLRRYPHELSGGQRQRVGVARALAADPPILLMDEPFGALDPLTRMEIRREFRALQQRLGKTIVIVTHDISEALAAGHADRLGRRRRAQGTLFAEGISAIARTRRGRLRRAAARLAKNSRGANEQRSDFFSQHGDEILQATLEHIWLVGATMLLAIAIGVPLGILVARRPWLSKPILGGANIAETIPSLALLGFLLPVPWLGDRADRLAITALTLYALLPIIRNTAAGITGVDPAVREAARGMGMTARQILFQVELPLSLSTVLAGMRVATVLTIGVATIAAAVGAGGLGEFIFRGLAMVNNQLILAGAIPAAALALLADFCLSVLERRLRPAR